MHGETVKFEKCRELLHCAVLSVAAVSGFLWCATHCIGVKLLIVVRLSQRCSTALGRSFVTCLWRPRVPDELGAIKPSRTSECIFGANCFFLSSILLNSSNINTEQPHNA
jgi:hypothetical protein